MRYFFIFFLVMSNKGMFAAASSQDMPIKKSADPIISRIIRSTSTPEKLDGGLYRLPDEKGEASKCRGEKSVSPRSSLVRVTSLSNWQKKS